MGFAEKERSHTRCRLLNVTVVQNDSNYFITPAEIRLLVYGQQGDITKKNIDKVDIISMEAMLKSNPYIAEAQVFATLDGTVNITVVQKKPIVRIINQNNESYYIDSEGELMPLSPDFTALVMVVNGEINEPYIRNCRSKVNQEGDTSERSLLPSVYKLSDYIYHNPFWKAFIPEVYVDSAGEFCLIPRVGNQRIILGDTNNMRQKFDKLWVLYHEGLNHADKWNDYSEINLKYNHQIVCTKK